MSGLGELIRRRRLSLGMTQRQLSDAVNEDQSTISQWENGKVKQPGREKLLALAAALDLSWEDVARAAGLVLVVTRPEPVTGGGDTLWIADYGRVPADSVRWTDMQQRGESVEVPRSWVEQARSPLFAVTVTGDCLRGCDPAISSGDIVVCQSRGEQDGPVRSGTIVLARVGSGYTLKVWHRVGPQIELRDGDGHVVQTLAESDDYQILGTYYKRYTP